MESLMQVLLSSKIALQDIIFAQPEWLWGILLLPILWGLTLLIQIMGKETVDDLSQLQNQRQLTVKHALIHKMGSSQNISRLKSWRFSGLKMGLNFARSLIIISLTIALASPEKIRPLVPLVQQKMVRDVVFVIESSVSFLLPDYKIGKNFATRMNVVKSTLDQFISGLEGNRFGLIIYAEKAYTLMPLTADQTTARLNLKRLKPYLAGRTDTAMGEALGLALKQTKEATAIVGQDTLKRVIVLISDGLSKGSRLELSEAINYAQLMQVSIYTIGVGANSKQADERLYTGLIYQPLESGSLKTIAEQTGGQYFQVGSGNDLSRVLQKINKAESVTYTPLPITPEHIKLYQYPLLVAVISILLYLFISIIFANQLAGKVVTKNIPMGKNRGII